MRVPRGVLYAASLPLLLVLWRLLGTMGLRRMAWLGLISASIGLMRFGLLHHVRFPAPVPLWLGAWLYSVRWS